MCKTHAWTINSYTTVITYPILQLHYIDINLHGLYFIIVLFFSVYCTLFRVPSVYSSHWLKALAIQSNPIQCMQVQYTKLLHNQPRERLHSAHMLSSNSTDYYIYICTA